jgi:hypothetical protein
VDVFGFVPRLQLVELLPQIEDRHFAEAMQYFLQKVGNITLENLCINTPIYYEVNGRLMVQKLVVLSMDAVSRWVQRGNGALGVENSFPHERKPHRGQKSGNSCFRLKISLRPDYTLLIEIQYVPSRRIWHIKEIAFYPIDSTDLPRIKVKGMALSCEPSNP